MIAERITDAELDGMLDLVPRPPSPSRDLADRIAVRCLAVPQENVRPLLGSSRVRLGRRPFLWTAVVAANALAAAAAAASWDGQKFDFQRLVDLPHKVAQTLHWSHPLRARREITRVHGHGSARLQSAHRVPAVPASLAARPDGRQALRQVGRSPLAMPSHPQKARGITYAIGPLALRPHAAARAAVRELPHHARAKAIAYKRYRQEQPFRVEHAPSPTSFSAGVARRARAESIDKPEQRAEGPLKPPENEAVSLQGERSRPRDIDSPYASRMAGDRRWGRRFQNREFVPSKNWRQSFPRRERGMGRRTRYQRRF